MSDRYNFRSGLFYVTWRDLEAIHNSLHQIHPHILWTWPERRYEPAISLFRRPREIPRGHMSRLLEILFVEPGWQPHFEPLDPKRFPNEFRMTNYPYWSIKLDRGKWDWSGLYSDRKWLCDFPTLTFGQWNILYDKKDAAERSFVNAVVRQLHKCMVQQWKGSMDWIGHDACRWATEGGPRRMIGGGWRPPDDYVFPADNPYYAGTEDISRDDERDPDA